LSFAAYVKFVAPGLPAAAATSATGLFLLAWTIFTAYMAVASLRVSGAVASVLVALFATFLLLTIGTYSGAAGITNIGGYVGLLTDRGQVAVSGPESLLAPLDQPPDHRCEDELHREVHLAARADDGVGARHEGVVQH
jgi:hypothetical protein